MSNLSDLLPAGAGAKSATFTANGTIASGKPVILETAGTVAPVAETSVSEDFPIGSVQEIGSGGATDQRTPATDNNNNMVPMVGESNTYVECLTNSSGYPCIAVNKLSDSNIITHGTQTVIASVATSNANIANDPTDGSRGMVTYKSGTSTYSGKVYTITGSGTSPSDYTITLSSSATTITTFDNVGNTSGLWMDPHVAGRFVYTYNYDDGTAGGMNQLQSTAMGLVSGTGSSASIGSVTQKTEVDTNAASYYYTYQCIGFDPNTANKLLLVYGVYGLPFPTSPFDRIQARVGILSSSTSYAPTWGTAVVFNSASSNDTYKSMSWLYQTADRAIAFYMDGSASSRPTARLLTIGSGTSTSITVGSAQQADTSYGRDNRILVQEADDRFVAFWNENSQGEGWFRSGTIDTSTGAVTWGTKTQVNTASDSNDGKYAALCFDGAKNGKFYFYGRGLSSTTGSNDSVNWISVNQLAATVTNLTSSNFVGISDEAIANTATGSVVVEGGVTEKVSSLTTGSTYYVQPDGTLGTSAGTPSVTAGKALSATKLLLKGQARNE